MASLAVTSAIIAGVGVGVSAVGLAKSAQAAAAQAEGQEAMAEYNAKVAEQEAKARTARSIFEQQRQAKEAERRAGSLRAGLGTAGVMMDVGTPLLLQAEQAAESELDNLLIGYEGQVGAARARSQAALDRMQASIYSSSAKSARLAGMVGAGTTLLKGFGKAAAAAQ